MQWDTRPSCQLNDWFTGNSLAGFHFVSELSLTIGLTKRFGGWSLSRPYKATNGMPSSMLLGLVHRVDATSDGQLPIECLLTRYFGTYYKHLSSETNSKENCVHFSGYT